jgi:RHS repeat-associated protein
VWPAPYQGAYYQGKAPRGDWIGSLVTGQQDATGLMYRRNRYYNPATGQFTQSDPIGIAGGLNTYGFAGGDPVSYGDPYGLCPPEWLCKLIGAAAGDDATLHWAGVANNSTGVRHAAAVGMGLFAALWTRDTYLATAATLLTAGEASAGLRASRAAGGAEALTGQASEYLDVTTGNSVRNIQTNVTRAEFESELSNSGWTRTLSSDGKVVNYARDGARYSVRATSDSTGGPTAEYFVEGAKKAILKIRMAP